ncbi:MAG TPA: winged helix-turn-helix domain-containing protein [Pyrinomonadaceae bacterium]|nr:winged helix-turn-helix domain-containing protein [Pyrinomonadaceae bacterium]
MASDSKHLVAFEDFRIDLEKKVLWRADEPVHLPSKAVELLCELVRKRGQVVTKEELLDRVWQDSFVEEGVLTQNIHHLRKAFRELELKAELIQTIPRRGYRFAGQTRVVDDAIIFEHEILERELLTEISEDSLRDLGVTSTEPAPNRRWFTWKTVTVASVLIVVTGIIGVWQLTSPASRPAMTIDSIAILPLKTLNENEKTRTLALGLTDSLIGRLGRLNRFAIRPFSAVEKYDASGKDAIAFARDLRTNAVLEGTIQTVDDRVRVNLRLLDVQRGDQLWAESFDEANADILKLQDLVSRRVAHALISELDANDARLVEKRPTTNPDAYNLYLAGREKWLKRNWTADSLAFYQKAIELDPSFALAYVGIADHYAFTYETELAESALSKAIALEPELSEAHATRGFLQMFHRWDWQGAESSLRKAIELSPDSSKAHHWFGVYWSIRGKHDEAIAEMKKALDLDPTALVIRTDIAELYYFKHEYQSAQAELQQVIEVDPTFRNAHERLAKVRFKNGNSYFLESAGLDIFLQKLTRSEGRDFAYQTDELERLVAAKDEAALRRLYMASTLQAAIARPEHNLGLSQHFAITGEKEKCLDALEKAVAARSFVTPFVAVDPIWDPVRDDPRFQDVVRRMNL